MAELDGRADWVAKVVTKHRGVLEATQVSDYLVEIVRTDLDPITIMPIGNRLIDESVVEAALLLTTPTAIVLVPKSGHYTWSARTLAMDGGSSVLTFNELYTFMDQPDPRRFVDKRVDFARTRLPQHSMVSSLTMICESSMLLRRHGSLSDLVLAVEYEYEFGEEALVRAIARHPDANVILNANPNGSTTSAARRHGQEANIPAFRYRELMGALNFDGRRFAEYTAPKGH